MEKSLFIYDGDCAFCSAWAQRLHEKTGDAVIYMPCKEAALRFPDVKEEVCMRAAQFISRNGNVCSGAGAVFSALRSAGRRKWLMWCYRYFPGFRPISEAVYRSVAEKRHVPGVLHKVLDLIL